MENEKHTGRYAKRGDFSDILIPLLPEKDRARGQEKGSGKETIGKGKGKGKGKD